MDQPSHRSILLYPGKPPGSAVDDGFRPWLDPYPVATETSRGAVVICPGGAYSHRAPHEGAPVAERFNREGIHAFVLHYRVAPHRYPAALMDGIRAIRIVRSRAGEWNVDPERIAVLGFSAGGHLAASSGVLFTEAPDAIGDEVERIEGRPDALVLCYPVITSGPFANHGSFENLLGPGVSSVRRAEVSLELRVTEETPPAFLWHTSDDNGVPVENSLLFAQALHRHRIPFELHVFPHGPHGLGLAEEQDPRIAGWMDHCCAWLGEMGWRPDVRG